MAATSADSTSGHAMRAMRRALTRRQLDAYPATAARLGQLAVVVLVTISLYYESYVGSSVSTLLLHSLGATFGFYVTVGAVGNLLGAFGSLLAGLTDRVGRANMVVGGLLVTGLGTTFAIPATHTKWPFIIVTFLIGLVEGIVLVATAALVRDFSPQSGRATAMGLWTTGPVLGSLAVSLVGSATITATTRWEQEYRICGIAGLAVFVVALLFLRELAPGLRDQVMVSEKDRVLIEARAKGIGITESLRHPWRQVLKPDVLVSGLGVSVFLLAYYTAIAFGVIITTTVFGFSLRDANGLGNWQWGADAIGLVVIGLISDRFRVRKPFMIVGGIGGGLMLIVFLSRLGTPTSYGELAMILAVTSVFFAFAYAPWMASFTETVEARNPALTGTGLAVWGWTLRIVIFVSFLIMPHLVTTVDPLVNYGATVQADAKAYATEVAFAQSHQQLLRFASTHQALIGFARQHPALIAFSRTHPSVIATATSDATQLANAQRFAPELAVIQAHPALFTRLASYRSSADIPPALVASAIAACGGGTRGVSILTTIGAHVTAIDGVIAVAGQLRSLTPYTAELKALAAHSAQMRQLAANTAQMTQVGKYARQLEAAEKAGPALQYLQSHATAVESAARRTPGQWRTWYWICVAACGFFLCSVLFMRGRWSPAAAHRDAAAHQAMLADQLARLDTTGLR